MTELEETIKAAEAANKEGGTNRRVYALLALLIALAKHKVTKAAGQQ